MTSDRLREALALLRWSQRGLAEALECDDRLVRRWASGDSDIPISVAAWLETLAQAHAAAPPPKGWRRRALAGTG
ncbi:helix-turn-helix domain-containing protein [Methylorubrum populi]